MKVLLSVVIVSLFLLLSVGCRKDKFNTDPTVQLIFSDDTVTFDTVFTTIGTITKSLKVFNPTNEKILISEIRVGGGGGSNFTINIDGRPGNIRSDVELLPKDSLFIFIKATIDPNNKNTPLIVTDSILFTTNTSEQQVKLTAFGQDAHYIIANKYISGLPPFRIVAAEGEKVTWSNDKPYVVYGYAVVDSMGSLTIGPGTKIHFHKNSGLWVYKGGQIKVMGEKDSLVVFQGDRLDSWYKDKPGQWDRIWLNESSAKNEFNYAVIRNGFIGIQAQIINDIMDYNQVVLNNVIIENMSAWGIFARMYRINATNTLISNCGEVGLYLTQGGYYDFRHCTVANYWSQSVRQTPAVVVTNYYKDPYSGNIYASHLDKAYFGNCILYGNVESELLLDNQYGGDFNYKFDNCLIKVKEVPTDLNNYTDCIFNQTPGFVSIEKNNYHIDTSSAAINKGKRQVALLIKKDLDQVNRMEDEAPDIGAYEYVPTKP